MLTRPSQLVLCGSCVRHFRLHEPKCPFCGAEARGHAPATPLRTPLAAGASRAQRYAVRAALVASAAGSASFGCSDSGSSTPDASATDGTRQGDGSFTSGGGAGATGGSGGIASGGTTGRAGESGGDGGVAGRGGTGQAGGGAGNSSGAGSVCPGAVNPSGMACRNATDCTPLPQARCFLEAPQRCGNPMFASRQCEMDMDCGAGMHCQLELCNATTCIANCTADSCGPARMCVDGSCVAKRCDEPGAVACAQGWRCDPGAASATADGCAPVPCGPTDPCATNRDCAPSNATADARGCAKRQCSQDGACDCGFCVGGLCEANLGFCYQEIAMPYGTVWPDEELI